MLVGTPCWDGFKLSLTLDETELELSLIMQLKLSLICQFFWGGAVLPSHRQTERDAYEHTVQLHRWTQKVWEGGSLTICYPQGEHSLSKLTGVLGVFLGWKFFGAYD